MLRQLIKIFRSREPLRAMGSDFAKMFKITYEATLRAGDIYFGKKVTPDERTWIYKQDVKVNNTIVGPCCSGMTLEKTKAPQTGIPTPWVCDEATDGAVPGLNSGGSSARCMRHIMMVPVSKAR